MAIQLSRGMLTGRYSDSAESSFDYDIKRFTEQDPVKFVRNTEASELSDAFWDNILVTRLDTSVASSPYFLVYLMAQVKNNARGFLSKQIDIQSLIEQRGDIHHIFPKKYLQKNGVNNRKDYNQIANYIYTQSEINVKIKDTAPCDYMKLMFAQVAGGALAYGGITDSDDLRHNLEENCIPEGFETNQYYRTNDETIKVGDVVSVPAVNGNVSGIVIAVEHYSIEDAPTSVDEMQWVLRKQ